MPSTNNGHKAIHAHLAAATVAQLDDAAHALRRSRSMLVRMIVEAWLDEPEALLRLASQPPLPALGPDPERVAARAARQREIEIRRAEDEANPPPAPYPETSADWAWLRESCELGAAALGLSLDVSDRLALVAFSKLPEVAPDLARLWVQEIDRRDEAAREATL